MNRVGITLNRVLGSVLVVLGVFTTETIASNAFGLALPTSVVWYVPALVLLFGLVPVIHLIDHGLQRVSADRTFVWYGLGISVWLAHGSRLQVLDSPVPWAIAAGILLAGWLPVPNRSVRDGPSVFLASLVVSPDWMVPRTTPVPDLLQTSFLAGGVFLLCALGGVLLIRAVHVGLRSGLSRRTALSIGYGAAAFLVLLAGWHWSTRPPEKSFQRRFRGEVPTPSLEEGTSFEELPPIILISIDTLRQDLVPPLAPPEVSLPHLRSLREHSVIFRNHFTTSSVTAPSHASLLSGRLPVGHGFHHNWRIDRDVWMYPQVLRQIGYRTAGFTGGGWVAERFGFGRGYERYWEYPAEYKELVPGGLQMLEWGSWLTGRSWLIRVRDRGISGRYLRKFRHTLHRGLDWIDAVEGGGRPFFLFLHTYQVHDYKRVYPAAVELMKTHKGDSFENLVLLDLIQQPGMPVDKIVANFSTLKRKARSDPFEKYGETYRALPEPQKDFLREKVGSILARDTAYADVPPDRQTELRHRLMGFLHTYMQFYRWLYNFGVQLTDRALGKFLDGLRERGLYRRSLIVFFSDHGEGFLHTSSAIGHGSRQLDEILVHTPLWIKLPGNRRGEEIVEELVQSTDVFPSVLQRIGIRAPLPGGTAPDTPRKTLLGVGDTRPSDRAFVRGSIGKGGHRRFYVRSRQSKFIQDVEGTETRKEAWFRVNGPRPSERPVARSALEVDERERLTRAMRELLASYWRYERAREQGERELPEKTQKELEGLGYL